MNSLQGMKTHTEERTHVCPVKTCAKSFSTSGNLSRHKRLHGYIEPIACPVDGCICTFPSNNKLEKHMKFHFANDVKVCLVPGCGKTFSTTGNLNRHLKAMHEGNVGRMCTSPTASIATAYTSYSPTAVDQWPTLDRAASGYFEPESLWTHAPLLYKNDHSILEAMCSDDDVLDALAVFFDEPESDRLSAEDAFPVEDYCSLSVFQSSLQFACSQ
ncbi:Zinc finger protein, partial [Globisporangium splendens]